MNNSHKTVFRIIKSSWGIYIEITAKTINNDKNGVIISDKIYLEITKSNFLNTDEIEFLIKGLKKVSKQIETRISKPIKIVIEDIVIVHTDFQKEGLFYGIIQWASEYFKFDMIDYHFGYNKRTKKYIFPDI